MRRHAESGGDHPALNALRGQIALKEGHAAEAVRCYRAALKADPNDRAILHGLATALHLAGDTDAAKPYLGAVRRTDALNPLIIRASVSEERIDPTLPAELGAACLKVGRTREALAWYRMAISRDPLDQQAQRMVYQLERDSSPERHEP